ncbi:hypothetical protein D3C72_2261550 [compost metagenome]
MAIALAMPLWATSTRKRSSSMGLNAGRSAEKTSTAWSTLAMGGRGNRLKRGRTSARVAVRLSGSRSSIRTRSPTWMATRSFLRRARGRQT